MTNSSSTNTGNGSGHSSGLTYQEVIDKQKKMLNRHSKGNKCIASRIWACREPARNSKQGVCDLHVNEVILVDWERCRLCEVSCFPYEMQSGSRSNAPLNHKNLKRDIPLVSYPYALDSYALFVFESADDAETAAEFIRREYAKPSQHRLHLIPLSYEDNVPDELVWKGKQIPFYFDKRRKELLPAVILDKWSHEGPSSPRPYLSNSRNSDDMKSNASRRHLSANARSAFSTIEHQLSLLRKAFQQDMYLSEDTEKVLEENKRLTLLVQQREARILELQRSSPGFASSRLNSFESTPSAKNASTSSRYSSGILQAEIALDRRDHSLSSSPPRQVSTDVHGVQSDSTTFGEVKLITSMDSDTDTNEEEKDPRVALLPSYQLSQRAKITHRHMQHSHQQHAQHRLNNAATGTLQMQQSATSAAVLSQSVAHPPQRQLQNFESGATIDHGGAVDISEGTMSENIATSAEVLFPDVSQSASAVRVTTHPTTMTSRTLHHIPSTTHPPRQQDAHYAATAASMMSHRMFGHSNNITTHVNTSTQHMSNHPDSVAAMALAYKNSKKRKLDLEQAAAAEAGVVLEDPTMVPNAELRSPRGVPQIKHSSRSPEAPLAFDMDVTNSPTPRSPFGAIDSMVDTGAMMQRDADWVFMQRAEAARFSKANVVDIRNDSDANSLADCCCNPWMPCPDATHVNSMLNSGATDEETPRHKDCEIDPLEDLTTRVAPDEKSNDVTEDIVASVKEFLKDEDSVQNFRDFLQKCDEETPSLGRDYEVTPRAVFLDFYTECSNYLRLQDKNSAKKLGHIALDLVNLYMATEAHVDTMLYNVEYGLLDAAQAARKRALARLCVWFSDFEQSQEFRSEASPRSDHGHKVSKPLTKQHSFKNTLRRWPWSGSKRGRLRGNSVHGLVTRRS